MKRDQDSSNDNKYELEKEAKYSQRLEKLEKKCQTNIKTNSERENRLPR